MSILVVHPKNERQEEALRIILDAFEVKYDAELNTTQQLLSSEANRKSRAESVKQQENGDLIKIALEDLWK